MADPTPLPEIPTDLDALSEADLRSLYAELRTARDGLMEERGTEGIAYSRAREIVAQVHEIDARLSTLADAVSERVTVDNDLSGLGDAPALPDPVVVEPAAEIAPEGDPAAEPAAVPAGAPAQVAGLPLLSAAELADQQDPGGAPVSQVPARVASLRAPEGSRLVEPGTELELADIGAMVTDITRGRSFNGRVHVAGIGGFEGHADLRGEILQMGNGPQRNDELTHDAQVAWRSQFDARQGQEPGARTAAICDPLDIIREIPDCVQAREPFSDSLPSRPAGRLGYQFTPAMALADMSDGVDVWDETAQGTVDDADPDTWKPCVMVDCPTPSTVIAEAITACFTFDNTTDMSNPERVRDAMSKINALRARTKTGRLLQLADTFNHHFDFVAPYGALPGIVHAILTVLPQGEFPERLDDGAPYVLYTPPGLLELLVIDRANKAYLTDAERGQVTSYIEQECAAAGWNVTLVDIEDVARGDASPFANLPTVGVAHRTPLPELGGSYKMRLLAPESFLYASTGSIEMGIERSPELNRRNKAQWFAEEYVMLSKNGCHPSYTIHTTVCPAGDRAGLVDPFTCVASSPS